MFPHFLALFLQTTFNLADGFRHRCDRSCASSYVIIVCHGAIAANIAVGGIIANESLFAIAFAEECNLEPRMDMCLYKQGKHNKAYKI